MIGFECVDFVNGRWVMTVYASIGGQFVPMAQRPARDEEIPNTRGGILDIIGATR